MISIDKVYQKVLAIANKEQRGYITPQEFNLFASQAQMDIFEQYFYDINQFGRVNMPDNDTNYSDMIDILEEKISLFEFSADEIYVYNNFDWMSHMNTSVTPNVPIPKNYIGLPEEVYRLGVVRIDKYPVELLSTKRYDIAVRSPLTSPTPKRPIMYRDHRGIVVAYKVDGNGTVFIANPLTHKINCTYIKKPNKPEWGYVVVNGKALYNTNTSKNILLHPSEEEPIVTRILELAGIVIDKLQLTQAAAGDKMNTMQIQNS